MQSKQSRDHEILPLAKTVATKSNVMSYEKPCVLGLFLTYIEVVPYQHTQSVTTMPSWFMGALVLEYSIQPAAYSCNKSNIMQ